MNTLRTAAANVLASLAALFTAAAGGTQSLERRVRPAEGGPRPVVPK